MKLLSFAGVCQWGYRTAAALGLLLAGVGSAMGASGIPSGVYEIASVDVNAPEVKGAVTLSLTASVAAWVLVGEPVVACNATWDIKAIHLNGERINPASLPASVRKAVTLYSVQLDFPTPEPTIVLNCDPGVLYNAGSGLPSFTVPGSLAWEAFFDQRGHSGSFKVGSVSADRAKQLMDDIKRSGFPPDSNWKGMELAQAKVNLWPVVSWYEQQKQQTTERLKTDIEENTKQLVSAMANNAALIDDGFDSLVESANTYRAQIQANEIRNKSVPDYRQKLAEAEEQIAADAQQQKNSTCVSEEQIDGQTLSLSTPRALIEASARCAQQFGNLQIIRSACTEDGCREELRTGDGRIVYVAKGRLSQTDDGRFIDKSLYSVDSAECGLETKEYQLVVLNRFGKQEGVPVYEEKVRDMGGCLHLDAVRY